jgi:hypothetical protein
LLKSDAKAVPATKNHMEKAGDLLSSFFNEELLKTARGYSALFSSWKPLVKEQFGPKMGDKLAAHSRIKELERFILRIETDHPGWIQILQTKQHLLLEAFRRRFPSLNIRGLSFRLSRNGEAFGTENEADSAEGAAGPEEGRPAEVSARLPESPAVFPAELPAVFPAKLPAEAGPARESAAAGDPYEKIIDSDFKNALKRLEQSITQNNRQSRSKSRREKGEKS